MMWGVVVWHQFHILSRVKVFVVVSVSAAVISLAVALASAYGTVPSRSGLGFFFLSYPALTCGANEWRR